MTNPNADTRTKADLAQALALAIEENETLRAQAPAETHDDVFPSGVKLNAQDVEIGGGIWDTVSLERGATFNDDGTVIPFEIAPVIPGAWITSILALYAGMHPYTAENALDGAIYGCNTQLRRKRTALRDQHVKIRGATRGYLLERTEQRKESLDRMTFYFEALKQQAREFLLLRGAYKVAWTTLNDGEVHMPRASRIAARQQIDVQKEDMDLTVAAALAVTGGTSGLQLDRGGRAAYQPVHDGTARDPSREQRIGIDGGYEARTTDSQRDQRQDDAIDRDGLPF